MSDGGVVWTPDELDEWSGGDPDEAMFLVRATDASRHKHDRALPNGGCAGCLREDWFADLEDQEFESDEEAQRYRDEQQAEYDQQWPPLDDVQAREF